MKFPKSYCNDPNFSDRQVCANSVDPDQTVQSDQGLHCLQAFKSPSAKKNTEKVGTEF